MSDTEIPQHGPYVGDEQQIELTEPEQLALMEAENTIHKADKQDDWRARYEHLAKAHRTQATRNVEVERELAECKAALKTKNRQIRDLTAERRDLHAARSDELEREKQAGDALFRDYTRLGATLAALVAQEHSGEVVVDKTDRRLSARVIEDGATFSIRVIDLTPTEDAADVDEDDEG